MLDPHLSNIKIIGNIMLTGKLTHAFAVFCRLDVFIRNKMIQNQCDLILMKNTIYFHFIHFMNCDRRCDIISEHQIQIRLDQLSRTDRVKSCVRRKNFLCHRHSHFNFPPTL